MSILKEKNWKNFKVKKKDTELVIEANLYNLKLTKINYELKLNRYTNADLKIFLYICVHKK